MLDPPDISADDFRPGKSVIPRILRPWKIPMENPSSQCKIQTKVGLLRLVNNIIAAKKECLVYLFLFGVTNAAWWCPIFEKNISWECLLYDSADARFHWSKQNINTDGPKYDWIRKLFVYFCAMTSQFFFIFLSSQYPRPSFDAWWSLCFHKKISKSRPNLLFVIENLILVKQSPKTWNLQTCFGAGKKTEKEKGHLL